MSHHRCALIMSKLIVKCIKEINPAQYAQEITQFEQLTNQIFKLEAVASLHEIQGSHDRDHLEGLRAKVLQVG